MPIILVPFTNLYVLKFCNLSLLSKLFMNIQLEKKNTVIILLLVVANCYIWRMHWIFTNNDNLETNMVKLDLLRIEGLLLKWQFSRKLI